MTCEMKGGYDKGLLTCEEVKKLVLKVWSTCMKFESLQMKFDKCVSPLMHAQHLAILSTTPLMCTQHLWPYAQHF